ncbi:alpha/beta hydrolase [Blastopirellula sp. J2-11]|uniref:alpha/beta hydrolase n=1 Tax=Blastopirellula sp. J2-11 TaxID=2943192 RepID=UPI0021CA18D5|nr:alpha/beta hydrolase [Blastopirellula sp. J2-11]UUO05785.1 alpha/beta hydrolase [Blastopirellula sp. J2-11]
MNRRIIAAIGATVLGVSALTTLTLDSSKQRSDEAPMAQAPEESASMPAPNQAAPPVIEPAEVELPREMMVAPAEAPAEVRTAPMMMRSTAETAPRARMMVAPEDLAARPPEMTTPNEAIAPQSMMAAPMMIPESLPDATPGYEVVEVLYGTDRDLLGSSGILGHFYPAIGVALGGLVLFGVMWKYQMARMGGVLAIVGVCLGLFLARDAGLDYQKELRALASGSEMFSGGRGELQFGACHISIPEVHEVGQLEGPSLLRLELTERPEKHVVLLDVLSKEEEAFFADLREKVAQSPRHEVLIFVHGFNVSFEDAARRTAQMAYDLKFTGVPMFYSWPSQADLFGYTTDRDNSLWTVSHLKEFLLKVAQQSNAESINLIAHSMGNRAMGTALEEIAAEMKDETKLFNQVVLAAPDVDATVFRDEIAPQIVRASKQVTLYASSNDLALLASKNVNGYPRAGDVRPEIVIVQGVDTIDVSAIDTSLIGHAYYGDNDSIICDIFTLLHQPTPASQRQWLQSASGPGGMYWVFNPANRGVANAGGTVPR